MAEVADARGRVQDILDHPDRLSLVFRPVVDLSSGQTVALAALSRSSVEPRRRPDEGFAESERVGLDVELELLALRMALRRRAWPPEDVVLAVNVDLATLCSEGLQRAMAEALPGVVVLELTEHSRVDNYEALTETIGALRGKGIRFAVDDTGAGSSASPTSSGSPLTSSSSTATSCSASTSTRSAGPSPSRWSSSPSRPVRGSSPRG